MEDLEYLQRKKSSYGLAEAGVMLFNSLFYLFISIIIIIYYYFIYLFFIIFIIYFCSVIFVSRRKAFSRFVTFF